MQSKIIAIITGVVLLAALVSLRLALRSSGPKYQPELHTSLGWELAQQTAVAVHDRGQVVAVVADVYEQSGFVLSDQWRAFVGELKNHAAITLAPADVVKVGRRAVTSLPLYRVTAILVPLMLVALTPEPGKLKA